MADTTHNVTIKANLDTSTTGSSGSTSGGGGGVGNAIGAVQAGMTAASMVQMKNAVDMILPAFRAVTLRLKELSTRVQAISYMYRKTHDTLNQADGKLKHLTQKIETIESKAVDATNAFKKAVSLFAEEIKQRSSSSENAINRERRAREENTRAIKQNSRANVASTGNIAGKTAESFGKSLQPMIAALGIATIGSTAAEILEMQGYGKASSAVGAGTTIGSFVASGAAFGSAVPGLGTAAGAMLGGGAGLVKSSLDLYKKSIQDSDDAIKKAAEAQEKRNQKIRAMQDEIAGASNFLRQAQQEKAIQYADDDEWKLRDLKYQYGQNIADYRRQILELNQEIANGNINTNFDDLKKQIVDVSAKMQVETNLYNQVSTQLDAVTTSAYSMKEAMDTLNQAFRNSLDRLDEIDTQEENIAFKRTIGTKSRLLTGSDQKMMEDRVAKYDKIVESYDESIDRIIERFNNSKTIEDKKNLNEQLDSLIKSRQHARSMQETFRGIAEQLKSVATAFDESAKSAQQKIIEMQSEIERQNFSERVKALGSEYAKSLIPEFENKLNVAREAAYEKWRKATALGITPEQQKKLIAEGDESARYAKILEQQLRELESVATSNSTKNMKLDDPTSVMTDLGKMGAYMSKQEMQLQDPQLSKLDEISKTLFDIRTNTRNNVSKFL